MNIRPLAASGTASSNIVKETRSSISSKSISQTDIGKARASWGKSTNRNVSFEVAQTSTVGSRTPQSRASLTSPTEAKSLTPLAKIPSPSKLPQTLAKQSQSQHSFAQETLDTEDGDRSPINDQLPVWQNNLFDMFYRLNGNNWREQGGWPANHQNQDENNIEIFGIGRPNNRPNEVVSIDLSWNNLNGDIGNVEGLWKLQSLEILHLGANKITGIIPGYEMKSLMLLKELHLYRNGLHGNIPSEIGQLRQLSSLWLFENHFTGPLPESIGDLSSLTDLRCNSNRLTGPLPSSLAQCVYLKTLNLQKNNFTGTLNEDIIMSCIRLRDLRVWSNKLTGALTPEINCLRFLEVLLLQDNSLSWVIPPQLGKCEHLTKVDLSRNKFRGEVPNTFGTLQKLEYMDISNNSRISGRLPRELQQLRNLTYLDVSCTLLSDLEEFARAIKDGRTASQKKVEVIIEGFAIAEQD